MLAAARMSAASESVIQSAGLGAIGQSLAEADFEAGAPESFFGVVADSPSLASVDGFAPSAVSVPASDFCLLALALRRSFLAQPDPLNTTVGAANAFRIGPAPHAGQLVGPWASIGWMTSRRCAHASQT